MRSKSRGKHKKSHSKGERLNSTNKAKKDVHKVNDTKISTKRYRKGCDQKFENAPTAKYEFFDDLGDKLTEFIIKSETTKDIGGKTIKLYDVFANPIPKNDITDYKDLARHQR